MLRPIGRLFGDVFTIIWMFELFTTVFNKLKPSKCVYYRIQSILSHFVVNSTKKKFKTFHFLADSSNGYTSRFLGFSIYVSNTTSKIDGVLCYKDNIFTTETIPAVFNITCAEYGQYVIYYNERLPGLVYPHGYSKYAFADICELEVYGWFHHIKTHYVKYYTK